MPYTNWRRTYIFSRIKYAQKMLGESESDVAYGHHILSESEALIAELHAFYAAAEAQWHSHILAVEE